MQYGKHKEGHKKNAARLNAIIRMPAFLRVGVKKIS